MKRYGTALVVLVCIALSVARWAHLLDVEKIPADFGAYTLAAQMIRDGHLDQVYRCDAWPSHEDFTRVFDIARAELRVMDTEKTTPYIYPPIFAQAIAILPWRAWQSLWTWWLVAMACALWGGFYMSLRLFSEVRPARAASLALAFAAFFECSSSAIALGQLTPLILLLTAAALLALERERHVLAGLALAGAIFLKLTPGILVLAWLARRQYRALASFACAFAALVGASVATAGVQPHLAFLERVSQASTWPLVAYNTHSLTSLIARYTARPEEVLGWGGHPLPPGGQAAFYIVLGALALALGFVMLRTRAGVDGRLADSAALLFMLVAPSFSWTHYAVFLVPACALALPALRAHASDQAIAFVGVIGAVFLARPLEPSALAPTLYDQVLIQGYTFAYIAGIFGVAWLAWRSAPLAERSGNRTRTHLKPTNATEAEDPRAEAPAQREIEFDGKRGGESESESGSKTGTKTDAERAALA